MFELFKSEVLRLRSGALIAMVGFIALFYLLARFGLWDITHRNMGFLLPVSFAVLSFAFGIVHGVLWKQKNFWFFLIHRPLATHRIGIALLGAGISALVTATLLSMLITLAGYDLLTEKVVDVRHYAFAFYSTLSCIGCYLVGTLTLLHRSKFIVVLFYVLLVVFFPEPQNALAQYVPLVVILAALGYLNVQCFKPDLNQTVKSPLALALMATGTSYGTVVALILGTTVFYHLPLSLLGTHPDMNPAPGTMKLIWKDNFNQGIGYVLENSDHPQAAHYAEQAGLADARSLPVHHWAFPRRQQLQRFDYSDALYNPDSGAIWKFSHDEMLLIGYDPYTQKQIGALGPNGYIENVELAQDGERFDQVPHLSGGEFLSTKNAVYTVDFDTPALLLKHQTPANEAYTSSLWVWDNAAMISTEKRLLIFDIATLLDDYSQLYVDYQFTYPNSVENAEFAYGFQVADGFVLMFYDEHYFGFDRPGAEVFVTRLDGTTEHLGGREFTLHDHPSWIRHYNFMVAPFIFVTEELLMHTIDPFDGRFLSLDQLRAQSYSFNIIVMTVLLQLLGVAGVIWLSLKHKLATSAKVTWVSLSVLMGLPVLLSYLLLNPLEKKA